MLQDENSNLRWKAAETLGKLRNSSETVVHCLLLLLQDEYYIVRGRAANILGSLTETVPKQLLTAYYFYFRMSIILCVVGQPILWANWAKNPIISSPLNNILPTIVQWIQQPS
ncbi:MAG: hypothetical protein SWX82_09980 [Cyanobacteriota bacterium]|nr:hypothetical protein [Cyanobacteriota bacterium]